MEKKWENWGEGCAKPLKVSIRAMEIRIENKSYDIALSEDGGKMLIGALDELQSLGANISAKKLLEAYLTKAAECEQLKTQLAEIEALVATAA
jgi:hypothetical protein